MITCTCESWVDCLQHVEGSRRNGATKFRPHIWLVAELLGNQTNEIYQLSKAQFKKHTILVSDPGTVHTYLMSPYSVTQTNAVESQMDNDTGINIP